MNFTTTPNPLAWKQPHRLFDIEQKEVSKFTRIETKDNVHLDDIHCLTFNSDRNIMTGSKDTTVKIWSQSLEELEEIRHPLTEGKINYEYWVTALKTFNDGSWVVGDRNGNLRQYASDNSQIASSVIKTYQHKSKERNFERISCISSINNRSGNPSMLLLGVAKSVQVWKSSDLTFSYETVVSQNDWVYCIEHLRDQSYLFVIGSNLELWENKRNTQGKWGFVHKNTLHREIQQEVLQHTRPKQRPLISSIEFLDSTKLGMVDFRGKIKIMDLNTYTLTKNYEGHKGRNWSIKKCDNNTFATCADDGLIKLWDARTYQNALTSGLHPGRVSNLLSLDEHKILASSCPNDIKTSTEKASLHVWDFRR